MCDDTIQMVCFLAVYRQVELLGGESAKGAVSVAEVIEGPSPAEPDDDVSVFTALTGDH
jgi:hypothetical protein